MNMEATQPACFVDIAHRLVSARPKALPLPKGEGRGEGKRHIQKSFMLRSRLLCCLAATLLAFCTTLAQAQPAPPHTGYVFPAGAKQGTTVAVVVGGQYLNNTASASVSGSGVQATFSDFARPLTQKEFNDLRDKLRELQQKRTAAARTGKKRKGANSQSVTNAAWTAADEKMAEDIRRKLFLFAPRRNQNPAIAETVTLRVTVAPDAEPGDREIRLATPMGLSNPLRFRIGQLPEFTKQDKKTVPDASNFRQLRYNNEQKAVAPTEMSVTLPAVLNGQILPGGVDRYRFPARKGTQLVAIAAARDLIPYLADAVPGWFQAALALYDAKGHELTHADHFVFHPDPVVRYEIPRDGEYILEIRDSIFRGREDFVYRITLGELPYVTSLFPLGGPAHAQTTVELTGWNLATNSLTRSNGTPGVVELDLAAAARAVNTKPFAVDDLPECLENEPNDLAAAQPVTRPILVNGRIDTPGDWDVFRFEGRAGEPVVAEVYARRLDSPLDSVLKLTDATGKQLAFNDDCEDKGAGLDTHFADSYLRCTLPADGIYYLHLGDAQRQGGPEYAYRLRLSAPRPDFALRAVPSSVTLRGGASAPITIYALRRDGFTNEITVSLADAPKGFGLTGGRIPANQDQLRMTLQAPSGSTDGPAQITLEGRAFVGGHPVVHTAVPAEDMMQAFAYRHLVPAETLAVTVLGRGFNRNPMKLLSSTPVKIPAGGSARVRISTPVVGFKDRFKYDLNQPPEGIKLGKVSSAGGSTEIELLSDAATAKPGLTGNLIVDILPGQAGTAAKKNKKQTNTARVAVATLPAIPFEVVKAAAAN